MLVVTPIFLPNTSADMHRARLLAPWASEFGWHMEILSVDPRDNDTPRDDMLLGHFPDIVTIHRVRAPKRFWHRWLGMNTLFRRSRGAIARAGSRLLSTGRFDLVFFSSTAFGTFTLGPQWKRAFGVPYVVDYQDPWVNDYYARTGTRPPGGVVKHGINQWLAKRAEPAVVAEAAGLIAVSSAYVEQLAARYGNLPPHRVLPFPAEPPMQSVGTTVKPGLWTSVGRGGPDLALAARSLFEALRTLADGGADWVQAISVRFIGTSYAPAGQGAASIAPVAQACGWLRVEEHTDRVPMSEAWRLQAESERLIVLLSDDPGYQPSKLAGLMLSGRPVLAVAPPGHPIHSAWAGIPGVVVLTGAAGARFTSEQVAQLQQSSGPDWPSSSWSGLLPEEHARIFFGFAASVA